jgi:hypothetical protein
LTIDITARVHKPNNIESPPERNGHISYGAGSGKVPVRQKKILAIINEAAAAGAGAKITAHMSTYFIEQGNLTGAHISEKSKPAVVFLGWFNFTGKLCRNFGLLLKTSVGILCPAPTHGPQLE